MLLTAFALAAAAPPAATAPPIEAVAAAPFAILLLRPEAER